jgi:hypothetical protein
MEYDSKYQAPYPSKMVYQQPMKHKYAPPKKPLYLTPSYQMKAPPKSTPSYSSYIPQKKPHEALKSTYPNYPSRTHDINRINEPTLAPPVTQPLPGEQV